MFVPASICIMLASVAGWVFWSAKISLSVVVGGAIGLANLFLWRRVVTGLIASRLGQGGSGVDLALRLIVKLGFLALFLLVALKSPLEAWGVAAGFGSTLLGLMWSTWMAPRATESQ